MRIQFVEDYEQYKKGEDHTVQDGLAQRLLEQGKARLPRKTDQKIAFLPMAQPTKANGKKNAKKPIVPGKKKSEGKK